MAAFLVNVFATKITIITGRGLDAVSIHTALPSPYEDPALTDGLYLEFKVTGDEGVAYCQKHFSGVPIERIDARTGERAYIENPTTALA